VHNYVRGHNFSDAAFDGIGQDVNLLEAGCARDAHGGIDEMAIARTAHPYAFYVQNTINAADCVGDFVVQSFGCGVQQSIKGAFGEL
jgi:hypothetical protein